MAELTRQQIRFFGRVQGVGFRYTCAQLAQQAKLTGWVRNEAGGTVLAEFQGMDSDIESVVQALNKDPYIRIDKIQRIVQPINKTERVFDVTY